METGTKIGLGVGSVVLAAVIAIVIYMRIMAGKKAEEEKAKDVVLTTNIPSGGSGTHTTNNTGSGGTNNTGGGGNLPPPPPAPAPKITSFSPTTGQVGTTVIITGTNFKDVYGVKMGGTDISDYTVNSPTKITAVITGTVSGKFEVNSQNGDSVSSALFTVTPTIKVYDPNSAAGKAVLAFWTKEIENNPTNMYEIKKAKSIGSQLFVGVSDSMYTSGGVTRSIRADLKRFVFDRLADGQMNWDDYGTYPIFTNSQKPTLKADFQRIIDVGTPNQTDWTFRNLWDFDFQTLGGANPFNWMMGDNWRKHELSVLSNIQQFCRNYIQAMADLEAALYTVTLRTMESNYIRFTGINA